MALAVASQLSAPAGTPFHSRVSFGMTDGMGKADAPATKSSDRHELVPILRSISQGDRDALSMLYRRTSAKLFGICTRLLGNEAEAEDVLQDVFVTVWRKAGRFDANKASPITWLAVIARNKAVDRLRQRKAPTDTIDAASDVADDRLSSFELLVIEEDNERLADCLGQLEDRHQRLIRAAFVDGATYPELADRETVPLGTMKSWIRRSLIRLRKCLER